MNCRRRSAPWSGKKKPSKAEVADEDDSDDTPLSEVAKKPAVPTTPVETPSAKRHRLSPAAKISKESSEDLSDNTDVDEDSADGLEHLSEVEDSEDDYANLTMDDEELAATEELRQFKADEFKFADGEPAPRGDTFEGVEAGYAREFPRDTRGNETVTPLGAFELGLGPTFFHIVCAHTNKYAKAFSIPGKVWQNVTRKELRVWHGLLFTMAIVRLPAMEDYWDKGEVGACKAPNFGRYMTLTRFKGIWRAMHWADHTAEKHWSVPGSDKIVKVRELVLALNKGSKAMFVAGKEVSVDEAMIAFKGRTYLRQYLPKKLVKWGFKVPIFFF